MLRGEALQEFEKLACQNSGTKNAHLKQIQESLLGCLPLYNALSNQKRAMCCTMSKPRDLPFKTFFAQLTELNNYLPLSPGSRDSKNMAPEELNEILIHSVYNGW